MKGNQLDQPQDATARRRLLLRRALAFGAMLAIGLAYRTEHLTDWDSWDYAAQAVSRHSSDLLLGRWWFIATMRTAYLAGSSAVGLRPAEGYLAMQAACSVMMAGAVIAGMAWTYRLTGSEAAEVIFAALMLPAPLVGIYAAAVMTEGQTLLLVSAAFWAWQRAVSSSRRPVPWALAGGLAFGAAVSVREPAVTLAAWPLVAWFLYRPPRRWTLLAAATAGASLALTVGILGAWAWYPWPRGYLHNVAVWMQHMSQERRQFPVSLTGNAGFLATYALAAAPLLSAALAPAAIWAVLKQRRMCWLLVAAVPYAAILLANHDLSVNPRFVLPLVWFTGPLVAAAGAATLCRGRHGSLRLAATAAAVLLAGVAAVAVGWQHVRNYHFDYAAGMARAYKAMQLLPEEAVVIAGPATPVARYLNRLSMKRFDVVGSGWSWPGRKLPQRVEAALADGKEVFIYLDAQAWKLAPRESGEWRQLNSALSGYRLDRRAWPMVRITRPHGPP